VTPVADFLVTLPHDHALARQLRAEIREWFRLEDLPDLLREDTLLVASELFSNAVGAAIPQSEIDVRITRQVDGLSVTLRNMGPGFDGELTPPPTVLPGGRGIAIARALGSLTVAQHLGYTTVSVLLPNINAPGNDAAI
jgi:anti-sigma regulatory factor (Ser/Thr protein kinase)